MTINKITDPEALIVGLPTVVSQQSLMDLFEYYGQVLGSTHKVGYWQLPMSESKKFLKKTYVAEVPEVLEYCENNGIKVIGSTTPEFTKFATGATGNIHMQNIGKALKGANEFANYMIVPILNYSMLFFQPQKAPLIAKGVETLKAVLEGTYSNTTNVLADVDIELVTDAARGAQVVKHLLTLDAVGLDIETTGLTLDNQLLTIGFAESPTKSYVFPLHEVYSDKYGDFEALTISFFDKFKGEQLWYNAMFDIPFILRNLLGVDPTNRKVLNDYVNSWNLTDVMHENYLTKNGLERITLGLKHALAPIYGEYDSDVDQANLLEAPFELVGKYNGYDTTGTFHVHEIFKQKLIEDEQVEILDSYYKPALKALIKMKAGGLPVNKEGLQQAELDFDNYIEEEYDKLYNNSLIVDFTDDLKFTAAFKYNQSHIKQKTAEDFPDVTFNPGSSQQKVELLVNIWGYPVLETTKTKAPSVGKDVIAKYINNEDDEEKIEVMQCILNITEAIKIRNTFLKGLDTMSVPDENGQWRVHGNYKLHGTVSGRMSSSEP